MYIYSEAGVLKLNMLIKVIKFKILTLNVSPSLLCNTHSQVK